MLKHKEHKPTTPTTPKLLCGSGGTRRACRTLARLLPALALLFISLLPTGSVQFTMLSAGPVAAQSGATPTPRHGHTTKPKPTPVSTPTSAPAHSSETEKHEPVEQPKDTHKEQMAHDEEASPSPPPDTDTGNTRHMADEGTGEHQDGDSDPHGDKKSGPGHEESQDHDDGAVNDGHDETGSDKHEDTDAHGSKYAPPSDLTKTIVLGGFAGINGTVIVVAAILKKKNPRKQRHSLRPRPAPASAPTISQVNQDRVIPDPTTGDDPK